MKNIELNVGGLIGAIACGGIAALILYLKFASAPELPKNGGPIKSVFLGSVIGGAFAGNFLWERIVKRSK